MVLSRRFKESFKTALAMVIAYGIALALDWENTKWTAFAVAFVSLATTGASLQKSLLRVLGTVSGVAAALLLLGLFPQDRWLFFLGLSLWVSFCAYMLAGPSNSYFWHVSGFVAGIICMTAGPDGKAAFDIAVLRGQETALGITVYGLVAVFLWPTDSRRALEQAAIDLLSQLEALWAALRDSRDPDKATDAADIKAMTARAMQAQAGLQPLLAAAEAESHEVRMHRSEWRLFVKEAGGFLEGFQRLNWNMAELEELELGPVIPALPEFHDQVSRRLAEARGLLEGKLQPEIAKQERGEATLALDQDSVSHLRHFERGALSLVLGQLRSLAASAVQLRQRARDIRSDERLADLPSTVPMHPSDWVLDRDRGLAALRVFLTLWVLIFALVYIDGVPGGATLISLGIPFSMVMMTMPMVPITSLIRPSLTGAALGGVLYLYVMPHYTSFLALGPLIFLFTFAVCFRFHEPKDMLSRVFALVLFLAMAAISNQQTYSFYALSSMVAVLALMFFAFWLIRELPVTSRPEAVILRLLGRFFGSAASLLSAALEDPEAHSPREKARRMRQRRALKAIPMKMGAWGRFLPVGILPGTTSEQVSALPGKLRVFAGRLEEVLVNLRTDQSPELVEALQADFRSWRLAIVDVLDTLATDPGSPALGDLNQRLRGQLTVMETRVSEVTASLEPGVLTETQARDFYRLMGSFRGISEALVDFRKFAGGIDWAPWREARFA